MPSKSPILPRGPVQQLIFDIVESGRTTYTALSKAVGRSSSYMQQFVQYGTPTKLGEDERKILAPLLGVPEDALRHPGAQRSPATPVPQLASELTPTAGKLRRVPVVGEVAAGVWVEVMADDWREPGEYLHVEVKGYERAQISGWRVRGPSMNLKYPDGTYVLTCPPAEAGVRAGDDVIVARRNTVGTEYTIKEVVLDEHGTVWLQPRSKDPAFQTPWRLERLADEAHDGCEITGVVIAQYQVNKRPNGPLVPMPGFDGF